MHHIVVSTDEGGEPVSIKNTKIISNTKQKVKKIKKKIKTKNNIL